MRSTAATDITHVSASMSASQVGLSIAMGHGPSWLGHTMIVEEGSLSPSGSEQQPRRSSTTRRLSNGGLSSHQKAAEKRPSNGRSGRADRAAFASGTSAATSGVSGTSYATSAVSSGVASSTYSSDASGLSLHRSRIGRPSLDGTDVSAVSRPGPPQAQGQQYGSNVSGQQSFNDDISAAGASAASFRQMPVTQSQQQEDA